MPKVKSQTRHIYCPPEVWKVWKAEAKRLGISVSAFLRMAADNWAVDQMGMTKIPAEYGEPR